MRAVWAWRLMMLVAVPSLLLLGTTVAAQLPFVLADPGHQDRAGLIAWAAAVGAGALALLASIVLRARGRLSAAISLAAIVALAALAGIGLALLVVGLFILKG
jgi:aconitase B